MTPSSRSSSASATFVLGLSVGLLFALAVERGVRFFCDEDMELVRTVRNLALQEFVEELDRDKLAEETLGRMLEGLDDYYHFYGPREISALERETSGEFLGIGVVFRGSEPGRVLFSYPGSPADRAGLRVGDRILTAAGQVLDQMAPGDLQRVLHREREEVRLAVEDLEGKRRELVLHPEVILDPTVRHARMLAPERGIGYLAIRAFTHRTPGEFDAAIRELQALDLRALVIDLRSNPGGILDSAVAIANRFLAAGALVATKTRTELRVTEAKASEATLAGLPLVVLLDSGSASASEVLASALQDHAVAALVGEPSYGKGTVQSLRHIGRGRAVVKLTTAHYYSPALRRIEHDRGDSQKSGIAPDLWVPISAEERFSLRRFLDGYSPPAGALEDLRQWEARASLDLIEDPPADLQLDAALALLGEGSLELHAESLQ